MGASPKLRNQSSTNVSPSQTVPNALPQQTPSPRRSNQTDDDMDALLEGFDRLSFNSPNSKGAKANTPGPSLNSGPPKTNQKSSKDSQKKDKSSAQTNEPPKQSRYGRKYKKPNRLSYT